MLNTAGNAEGHWGIFNFFKKFYYSLNDISVLCRCMQLFPEMVTQVAVDHLMW